MLHFADIHIGMENYGRMDPATGLSTRVMDFLRRLDDMIAYAIENDADIAVFAGDAFKTRNPNPTFQREFAYRVLDLAAHCPVVLLVGNHDIPPNVKRASSIELYSTLNVPNVYVGMDYEVLDIETKAGMVKVATAPYPVRERLLEESPRGLSIADLDDLLQEELHHRLDQLADNAAQSDCPRVLAGHFTVHGAMLGSERQVMLGRDVAALLSSVADRRWDYVALGHIHKFQDLTRLDDSLPPVVYSGSMERIDFGEEGDPKGFVWVELERGKTRYEFVELNARPFITLKVDVRGTLNPSQNVIDAIEKHTLDDAVVRLLIQSDVQSDALLKTKLVEEALMGQGANMIAAIKRDVERPDRIRFEVKPEELTPSQLLEKYLSSKNVSDDESAALLDAAEEIFKDFHDANL